MLSISSYLYVFNISTNFKHAESDALVNRTMESYISALDTVGYAMGLLENETETGGFDVEIDGQVFGVNASAVTSEAIVGCLAGNVGQAGACG